MPKGIEPALWWEQDGQPALPGPYGRAGHLDPVVPEWLDRQLAVAVHQARLLVAAESFRVKATEAEVFLAEAMAAVFPGEVMVAAGMEDES